MKAVISLRLLRFITNFSPGLLNFPSNVQGIALTHLKAPCFWNLDICVICMPVHRNNKSVLVKYLFKQSERMANQKGKDTKNCPLNFSQQYLHTFFEIWNFTPQDNSMFYDVTVHVY